MMHIRVYQNYSCFKHIDSISLPLLGIANGIILIYNKRVMDKKKILIVEDDESMLSTVSDYLETQEFEPLTARDGEEGLEIALKEHPDLILLDILMPKMDGMVMLKKLRENDWGKQAAVIILTNVSPNANSVINSVLQNEPAYYLVKSDVKLEGIVDKIKDVLKMT